MSLFIRNRSQAWIVILVIALVVVVYVFPMTAQAQDIQSKDVQSKDVIQDRGDDDGITELSAVVKKRFRKSNRTSMLSSPEQFVKMLQFLEKMLQALDTDGRNMPMTKRIMLIRRLKKISNVWKDNEARLKLQADNDAVFRRKYNAMLPLLQSAYLLNFEENEDLGQELVDQIHAVHADVSRISDEEYSKVMDTDRESPNGANDGDSANPFQEKDAKTDAKTDAKIELQTESSVSKQKETQQQPPPRQVDVIGQHHDLVV
mmetsp:Transcript_14495/g.24995  ORF Transcript_14495/g.24995 Transcript_14495/m.24995 type:complete len:260 (-) Transcript_14495:1116-1895(-)